MRFKTISNKLLAISLGVMMTLSVGLVGNKVTEEVEAENTAGSLWKRVTSVDAIESGAKYVVMGASNSTNVMAVTRAGNIQDRFTLPSSTNSTDLGSNTIDDQNLGWILTGSSGVFTISSVKDGTSGYLSYSGNSNTVNYGTISQTWTFTWDGTLFNVQNNTTTTRYLQYNASAPRFACYKNTLLNLSLYKYEEGTSVPVTDVELNKSETTIGVGRTEQLIASVLPVDATEKGVTWESSNTNIATVSSLGLVTGISIGQAIIKVTSDEDEDIFDTCDVTITELQTNSTVVISEAYGGGGNSGSHYKNDFVELYNPTEDPIDLSSWSIQYAATAGTNWTRNNLEGTIMPKGFYLIEMIAGAGGVEALPLPDLIGTANMAAANFKLALVNNQTTLSGNPEDVYASNIVDFLGVGTANTSETAPAPGASNNTSVRRKLDEQGYPLADTDDNSNDFEAVFPTPYNSALGVAHFIMDGDVEGQCVTKYSVAKTMVLSLTSDQLDDYFKTENGPNEEFLMRDARQRYIAWANNRGDETPYSLGSHGSAPTPLGVIIENSILANLLVILIISSISAYAYSQLKKRYNRT
jgi:hypothetical protein